MKKSEWQESRPKHQVIWTNNKKQYFIDGKEVDEAAWIKEVEYNKTKEKSQ